MEAIGRGYRFMEMEKRKKLQFRIDLVLTVLFIGMIFFFLIGTIVFGQGLWGRTFYIKYVGEYLEDRYNYTPWEWLEASKLSLDNYISSNLYGTSTLGQINSTFQYALGKRLVSTGGAQMIRLNTGHLYDLQDEKSMEAGRDDVLRLLSVVPEETPVLFLYEHPTLYDEDAQMPKGYEFMDFSAREADEIIGMLRDSGLEVIDSREVVKEAGLELDEFLMRTDNHWATRAPLTMARTIAGRIAEVTGVDIPVERLQLEQFDTEVHSKIFLGKYGQRVGTIVAEPDDIVTYTPKYDTHIQLSTSQRGDASEAEGRFEDVCLRKDVLKLAKGESWNTVAYRDYGLIEDYDILHNEDGADLSILLVRDSFGAPIGRFLSLVAKDVCSVELRTYYGGTMSQWLEKSNPDIVVIAYSLQMLRNENYVFE